MDYFDINNEFNDEFDGESREEMLRRFRKAMAEGKDASGFRDPDMLEELVEQCIDEGALA